MVGLRYTRAKRRNRFISFISLISMAGIALGVAVLIVVLSVMNGFQTEVRTRILGVASHLVLTGPGGVLTDWKSVVQLATWHPRVLAAAPRSIMQVFMVQGSVIGVVGTILGVVGGVLLAINVEPVVGAIERTFGVSFMDKSVYLIPYLPSEVHSADVLSIALISLVLSFLATLYPSWRASRVNPAEALRYE